MRDERARFGQTRGRLRGMERGTVKAEAALVRSGHVLRRGRTAVAWAPSHHLHRVMIASESYETVAGSAVSE